jgi:hypothetical protein
VNIESIIKRKGGTQVVLGGIPYHFEPNDNGDHVCDVHEPTHIERFLEIKEGFRVYDPEPVADKVSLKDVKPKAVPAVDRAEEPEDEEQDDNEEASEQVAEVKPVAVLDRQNLVEQFIEKFGRKPHHKWSEERIARELES